MTAIDDEQNRRSDDDELREAQQEKGYGADEGEREAALEEEEPD